MKFQYQEKKVDMFKKSIDILKDSLDYVNIECRKSGLFANSINLSQTGILQMFMSSNAMESYNNDGEPNLGIRLETLTKCLKTMSSSQTLSCSVIDQNLKIESSGKYKVSSEFDLCDIEKNKNNVDVEYEFVCSLNPKILYTVLKDLGNIGNEIVLTVNKDNLSMCVEGVDVTKTNVVMDDFDKFDLDDGVNQIVLKLGIADLLKYAKLWSISDDVQIHMKRDNPICLHYTLKEGFGWFRCFLAPMV